MVKGQTLYMQSILSRKQKENLELLKLIRETNKRIARTKRYLLYLERMQVQTVDSIYLRK